MGDARARIAESRDELRALNAEIAAWHAGWRESRAIDTHRTQLRLVVALLHDFIDLLNTGIGRINPAGDVGAAYTECLAADERLHYVRTLWRYYADKFDQRAGPDSDEMTRTLRAADEVIWSCWKTALKALGAGPESYLPAPLAYLSPQLAASTINRTIYPDLLSDDLRKVFEDQVRQVRVPVIALPPGCQRRPWWLVTAAHEVGHHVYWALPGVGERAREAITAATGGLAAWQPGWHEELFADACAVLLTGPAVIWAIRELETGLAPALGAPPRRRYPPPVVRLAVARAVAERAGLSPAPGQEPEDPAFASVSPPRDADEDTARLLECVPAVADALLGVTSDSGAELRELARATARAYDGDVISYWARALLSPRAPIAEETLGAARFCVAGSVTAWQSVASRAGSDEELAERTAFLAGQVRSVLPDCAEPGNRGGLAGTDIEAQASELARRFAADLYATGQVADQAAAEDDEQAEGGDGEL